MRKGQYQEYIFSLSFFWGDTQVSAIVLHGDWKGNNLSFRTVKSKSRVAAISKLIIFTMEAYGLTEYAIEYDESFAGEWQDVLDESIDKYIGKLEEIAEY